MASSTKKLTQSLRVEELFSTLFLSIDIAHIIAPNLVDDFLISRTSDNWLEETISRLSDLEKFNFEKPYIISSQYAKTDRGPRNTFPTRHAKKLLPCRLDVLSNEKYIEGMFSFYGSGAYISPQGVITFRIEVQKNSTELISIVDTIDSFNRLMGRKFEVIQSLYTNLLASWNNGNNSLKLLGFDEEIFNENAQMYDVIDLDLKMWRGGKSCILRSIKDLYTLDDLTDDLTPVRELSALSRMSVSSALSLKETNFDRLKDLDLGARDDEFWSVSRDRIIRCHPDRLVPYNIAFFTDVKEAVCILNAQQCVLDFLTQWLEEKRTSLVGAVTDQNENEKLKTIDKEFGNATKIANLLISPVLLERNVKHEFYQKLVFNLVEKIGINKSRIQASDSLQDFTNVLGTVANFSSYDASQKFNDINSLHHKVFKKQNRAIITLTILIIAVMFLQTKDELKSLAYELYTTVFTKKLTDP